MIYIYVWRLMVMSKEQYMSLNWIWVLIFVFIILKLTKRFWLPLIKGSENGSKWIQSIYGHKNQFMNPIHQNYGHVKAIEALLKNNGLTDVQTE
jgi:hypothetical protein